MAGEKSGGKAERRVIAVRGARVNNLKGIDVDLPRNALTVITGVSGSGKSSLAFDTLYAEGQRRFVESLSAYARPAVAIEQQQFTKNPRSTVGTTTEVYDYLRLLYGRIGIVIDKDTGEVVRKDTPESVLKSLLSAHDGERCYILARLPFEHGSVDEVRSGLQERGFNRLIKGEATEPMEVEDLTEIPDGGEPLYILVDRVVISKEAETVTRITDSLELAFETGEGRIVVRRIDANSDRNLFFSSKFESARSQTQYIEPEPRLFSFNNPFGACPTCQGFGRSVGIDLNIVIPDKTLSIKRGALHPFRGETFGAHLRALMREAPSKEIPLDKPIHQLTDEQMEVVLHGFGQYVGVYGFFKMLEEKSYKTHYRVMLSRYRGYTTCRSCKGSRLRTAARQVFVAGKNIPSVVAMTLEDARDHFDSLKLTKTEQEIVGQILLEIQRRLHLLCDIGLEYLTLDRLSHTLSGGESQRINLATSLGSSLVGTLYVLDEPSIGLHPRDTERLLKILRRLRSLGNTVVVVEHDVDVMRTADHIIDIGPRAGEHGGEVVFEGSIDALIEEGTSLTADYLSGRREVDIKARSRKGSGQSVTIRRPTHHNLKGDDVSIPLGKMTVVTGVSGSGKSSMVHDVIYGGIQRIYGGYSGEVGTFDRIEGLANIDGVEMIDQAPIGRSSRSTPATYTKVFDHIRDVFASTQAAKQMGWKPGHFSFNVNGGRCETCEGEGRVRIEMQFLPDLELPCEVCGGTRYKREAAHILYKGKSIVDVLEMSVVEALDHFSEVAKIVSKLEILRDVGLGYVRLGQSSSHLSGGEAQRIKLAGHLDTQKDGKILFIFDEPTTGLHIHDVKALMSAFDKLVDRGHTVLIIEHNLHVMASADWIIDLGPEGGSGGGHLIAEGTPRQVAQAAATHTGKALKRFFAEHQPQRKKSDVAETVTED
jgi:excinuclease ABC subunit A